MKVEQLRAAAFVAAITFVISIIVTGATSINSVVNFCIVGAMYVIMWVLLWYVKLRRYAFFVAIKRAILQEAKPKQQSAVRPRRAVVFRNAKSSASFSSNPTNDSITRNENPLPASQDDMPPELHEMQ